jgi:hypothetical protein
MMSYGGLGPVWIAVQALFVLTLVASAVLYLIADIRAQGTQGMPVMIGFSPMRSADLTNWELMLALAFVVAWAVAVANGHFHWVFAGVGWPAGRLIDHLEPSMTFED